MKHVKELLKKYIEADNQILEERDAFVTFQELIDELQEAIEQDEKENGWIPVSERLPETDDYILLSFANYSIPIIGRCERDKDGNGIFYAGDDLISCLGNDLYVNAWMELPERYREDES
jgi:hypothetical protein